MTGVARRIATYADVLAAPEGMVAEVLGGELHLQPRPRRRHTRTASSLGGALFGSFDSDASGPGGWIILDEPELHLGADILVPDLAGWREERFPGDADSDDPFIDVAPDWACEILSDSTARKDRMKKIPIYAREGVPFAWIIDPRDRTIEVLRLRGGAYELVGTWGGDLGPFSLVPFDAVALTAAQFWGRSPKR